MKRLTKIISALLAVLMVMGTMSVAVSASIPLLPFEGQEVNKNNIVNDRNDLTYDVDYEDTIDVFLGETSGLNNSQNADKQVVYKTPQERLAGMSAGPIFEQYGYQLWIDDVTGEVATVKVSTGEILFSNPWDTQTASYTNGSNKKTTSLAIKKQLLSQIVINYVDNDTDKVMYSSIEAAARDQINVEYINNGIRVEYSIGREETRMLVPKLINKERFETKILKPMRELFNEEPSVTVSDGTVRDENGKIIMNNKSQWPKGEVGQTYKHYELVKLHDPNFNMAGELSLDYDTFEVKKVAAYYTEKNIEKASSDREASSIMASFPITKKMAVYVFDPTASTVEQMQVERRIKDYVPTYTYEELDYDHELTEYVGTDKPPALFKMALEYTLDENGMSVRLPANGIRFDQSLYQLTNIEMLPYMGAGSNDGDFEDGGDGYTFFPDGSGALFDFEQLNTGSNKTINGKVYGQDFAYHQITGTYQETIRYPAFGIVEKWEGNKTVTDYDNVVTEAVYDSEGNLVTPAEYGTKTEKVKEDHGFLAIIEEGDALAELSTFHMSATSIYNTVRMIFYPRPKDSYNMADALSVGSNTKMTVVSDRKYVGSYKVRYIMLSDDKLAAENKLSSYYEASWMGMAVAYRDYLEANNVLNRLTEADVDDDIPLYIETFGALWTTEKILSIPVDVMTPLTSFEDIKTMYTELSSAIESSMAEIIAGDKNTGSTEESIKDFSNLNFKLTGYANGGMYATVPYNLNWEAAVGGADGFQELVDYSREEGFDLFPDFDFVYINSQDSLDGVTLKTDAVKTIDNRYTGRRIYSATTQTHQGYFGLAIAPSCFEKFVTKLAVNYLKYNPTGISVSTLGTDLNSDFDEEDPLNREDSKAYTIEAFKQLSLLRTENGESLEVMTDGGNAYSWRYVDHIVNMPLNSSRYNISSNAVPFIGVVLHGYVQFAGTPINEEGDIEFAFLKAIENGANLYFTLSYQNTQELKEYVDLSQHFSIRYDIWKDDVVEMYVELNDLLCDLQTKLIIDHEFLIGDRVPDDNEAIEDQENIQKAEDLKEAAETIEAIKQELKDALALRHSPTESVERIETALFNATEQAKTLSKYVAKLDANYVAECVDIIRGIKSTEASIAEAKKDIFDGNARDAALAEVVTFIKNKIAIGMTASDSLINDLEAAAGLEAEELRREVVDIAINAAAAEAVRFAISILNESYTSTAVENEALAEGVDKIVDAVVAATAEYLNLFAAQADNYKLLTATVEDIKTVLSSGAGAEAIANAKTAYNAAITAAESKLNIAVDENAKLSKLIADAVKMGMSKEDVDNAVALYKALESCNYAYERVDATTKSFNTLVSQLRNAVVNVYNKYNSIIESGNLTDNANLKTALKNISKLEENKTVLEMYDAIVIPGLENDPYLNQKNNIATAVSTYEAEVAKLDEATKTAAMELWNSLLSKVSSLGTDAAKTSYENIVKEINKICDENEGIYLDYSRDDLKEAVKLINNVSRASAIMAVAKTYAAANVGNFTALKAYAKATEDYNAANAAVNALDTTIKKRATNVITRCEDLITNVTSEINANIDNLYLLSAAAVADANALRDSFIPQIDVYKAAARQVAELTAAKTAASEALKANEKIAIAKTDADILYNEKKNAFEAIAGANTASAINTLLDDLIKAQDKFDTANAAYLISKAICLPHDNATDEEIKLYSTTAEIRDYERKRDDLIKAQGELDAAKQALEEGTSAYANAKTELDAMIDAYYVKLQAKKNADAITEIGKAVAVAVAAEGDLDLDNDRALKVIYTGALNVAIERSELNAAISGNNSYSSAINSAANAFASISNYKNIAANDLATAIAATEKLALRVETTKSDKEAAEWVASIYEIAVAVAGHTVGELRTLAEQSDGEVLQQLYSRALTIATTDIEVLKANAEASTEEKSEAKLLYAAAEANAKHSRDGLVELNESYQLKFVTAEREMNNAKQFYDIAVKDTAEAQAKYDEIVAVYEKNKADYESLAALQTGVLLFGDDTLAALEVNAMADIKLANDLYDAIVANIAVVSQKWSELKASADVYKAAKEAYDALLAVDISKLTEEQKAQNRSDKIFYAYKLQVAEAEINAAKAAIDLEHLGSFKDKYSQVIKLIDTVVGHETKIKTQLDLAESLYNKVKDDAAISAEVKNDAKVAYENVKALYEKIESNNDKFITDDGTKSVFETLCDEAYELGLLAVKDETAEEIEYTTTVTVTKLVEYINELFGTVAEEEKDEEEDNKYLCDDGSIVAVTYGGKNGNDADAYRTFLLNFNSFKVTVTYEGTEYTIDAYGYYVIDHNKEGEAA